jgi:class 3 adenylate cyclase
MGASLMSDDIKSWLERFGFGKYADAFTENEIDFRALLRLTEDDLKELGLPLGARRNLQAAIEQFSDEDTNLIAAAQSIEPTTTGEAERRQLTVMFSDLVGSTRLSTKLDPEDLREINRAYQDACTAAIERFDGYVARYMGDGALAYFGYPQAHEDDAERAVKAGLRVVDALQGVNANVGEERGVELAGAQFGYEDLGTIQLGGIADPIHAWEVTGETTVESRFEARRRGARLTSLVGRDEEVDLLRHRWEQAKSSEGRVVLLVGEPGIGKSRLADTLREHVAGEPHTELRYYYSPHYQNSALQPVIAQLERAAKFAREDPFETKLDKLARLLALAVEDTDKVAPLFAALLSIPTRDRYPPISLTPKRQKELLLEALEQQLVGLAAQRPVLMLFEDLHWIDPTSLELLERLVDRLTSLSVLLLVIFRPEFTTSCLGHPRVTALNLNRLSGGGAEYIVEEVTGGKSLPPEVVEKIVAKTDGVPLFVEELTKNVIEAGFLKNEGDHYTLVGPVPSLACTDQDHGLYLGIRVALLQTRPDAFRNTRAQGIHGWVVDGDDADGVVPSERDRFCHGFFAMKSFAWNPPIVHETDINPGNTILIQRSYMFRLAVDNVVAMFRRGVRSICATNCAPDSEKLKPAN